MPPVARVTTFNSDLPRSTTLVSDAASTPSTSNNNARGRRATGDLTDPARPPTAQPNGRWLGQSSVFGLEFDSEDDIEYLPLTPPTSGHPVRVHSEDIAVFVQEPIPSEAFTESDLVEHLRRLDDSKSATALALDDLWGKRAELDPATIVGSLETQEDEPSPYTNATYEVYDVLKTGMAVRGLNETAGSNDGAPDDPSIWETIKVCRRPPNYLPLVPLSPGYGPAG